MKQREVTISSATAAKTSSYASKPATNCVAGELDAVKAHIARQQQARAFIDESKKRY